MQQYNSITPVGMPYQQMYGTATGVGHIIGELPAFALSIGNLSELINDYHMGKYQNTYLPVEKITISGSNLAHTDYNDTSVAIYSDRYSSTKHTIVHTNCANYSLFLQDGNRPPKGGTCDHCRDNYTNYSMGVPIKYVMIKRKEPNTGDIFDTHVFYMDDTSICSFECMIAYIKSDIDKGYMVSNPFYKDAIKLANMMMNILYPGESIKSAVNPKLRKMYGGSLSEIEARSQKHTYYPLPSIIIPPIMYRYDTRIC